MLFNFANIFAIYSTPETFDIVSQTIDIPVRKNLSQISRVLTQITRGEEFGEDSPSYVPINDFVKKAMKQISNWLLNGACCAITCAALTYVSIQSPMFPMLRRIIMRMSSWTQPFNPKPSSLRLTKFIRCMVFYPNILNLL